MRHRKTGYRLGLPSDQRLALKRSLARSLFLHKKIKTTFKRAQALRGFIDTAITLAKKEDLASRRKLLSLIPDKKVVKQAVEWAQKTKDRKSGFTRVIRLGDRRGDHATMAIFEMVDA